MAGRLMPLFVGATIGAVAVALWHTFGATDDRLSTEHVGVPIDAATVVRAAEEFASQPDIDAALAALPRVSNPIDRRVAALELIEVLDNDETGIDRIAAALTPPEALLFRIDAIVQSAERDPAGALDAALALPERSQQQLALKRMVPTLARLDAVGALTRAEMIDASELRRVFSGELLNAWAALDPDAVLEHLLTAEGFTAPAGTLAYQAYEATGASDPEGVLAVVSRLPDTVRQSATYGALSALVERDAAAAFAYIETLPPGISRDALLPDVVQAYAASDPDGALALADSGISTHNWFRSWVLAGIQRADPDLALELAVSELTSASSARRGAMQNGISEYIDSVIRYGSPDAVASTFDRLVDLDVGSIDNLLNRALANSGGWLQSDPESVFDWALRHADRLQPGTFLDISQELARANGALARQALYRLPEEMRAPWVTGLVRAGADFDPDGTRALVLGLPAGALRDAALRELLRFQSLGGRGPVDISLFGSIGDQGERDSAAYRVAVNLASGGDFARACQIAGVHIVSVTVRREASERIETCRLD